VFEGFRLDGQRRVLFGADGQLIPLTPRQFDALLYFVERPGQLLTKKQLLEAIWPRVVVEEQNLNKAISELRHALGEKPGEHKFFVTKPGHGYRFVAKVSIASELAPSSPAIVDELAEPHLENDGGDSALEAEPMATGTGHRPWSLRLVGSSLAMVALLAGAAVWLLKPAPPAAPTESAPTRPVSRFVITPPATALLASARGLNVAISPDGKRIAYVVEKPEGGILELYVRELDALESRPIQGTERPVGGLPMNPFFSPDGKSIGFSAANPGIFAATVDGGPSIKLLDRPVAGAWWSGDNTIIYSTGRQLQRVSADGGMHETLMASREGRSVAAPVLLPGGHAVLYDSFDASSDRVAVLDLGTGQEKTVVEGGSNPAYVDTGHVVFARGDTLMAVPFKASELAVTGEPVALVQGIRRQGRAADYALSTNGTLVYVPGTADAGSNEAVVWVDRAGKVTGRAVPDLVANPSDPRLSPDGGRLLLVTGSLNDGDLWSYDLGGRPPTPLALPNDNRFPVWSPDGKRIAFASGSSPFSLEVFTMPADGSALPESLHVQSALPQVWSAGGELILDSFTGGVDGTDIVAAPVAAGGEVRKIVATEFNEYDPALSPNGRWLAYVSNRTGVDEIWVQAYPDGVPKRVSSNGGYEPLWSADGRELFFRQGSAMMAAAVETGAEFSFATPKLLFSGNYLQTLGRGGAPLRRRA
jgi:serine/threonine-protein kinase